MKDYGKFLGFSDAYSVILEDIRKTPEHVNSPRGQLVHEVSDACFTVMNVRNNMFYNINRKFPKKYLAGELLWYFSGKNDLEFIKKFSKFWEPLANEDGTCNSAYGNLIFKEKNEHGKTEWQWARERLILDRDSRQALIRFNKPRFSYDGVKDFVCTLNGVFSIRGNELNLSVMMRSSDIWYGITYDIPFFTTLMQVMRLHLIEKYPDLVLGSYTHHSVSLHMYERNFEVIDKALDEDFSDDIFPELEEWPVGITGEPHPDIIRMCAGAAPQSDDKFFKWIYDNAISPKDRPRSVE